MNFFFNLPGSLTPILKNAKKIILTITRQNFFALDTAVHHKLFTLIAFLHLTFLQPIKNRIVGEFEKRLDISWTLLKRRQTG